MGQTHNIEAAAIAQFLRLGMLLPLPRSQIAVKPIDPEDIQSAPVDTRVAAATHQVIENVLAPFVIRSADNRGASDGVGATAKTGSRGDLGAIAGRDAMVVVLVWQVA